MCLKNGNTKEGIETYPAISTSLLFIAAVLGGVCLKGHWRSRRDQALLEGAMQTIFPWQREGELVWPEKLGLFLLFFFFFFYPRIEVLNGVCFLVNTFVPLAWGGGSLLLGSGPKLKREERGKSAIISATTLPKFPFFTAGIGKGNQISKCSG